MEIHNIISAQSPASLIEAENEFIKQHPDYQLSFKRYFLSSPEQKRELLDAGAAEDNEGNVSFVLQTVLGQDKIAVWIYLIKDCPVQLIWKSNLCSADGDSEEQMRAILEGYEADLADNGLRIADNCIRTWIYVDDIDRNYAGIVVGRRENFERQGMRADTHYIASTGIYGGSLCDGSVVQMDALAVKGQFTQHYLYAPDNFNPTHQYGVTFERGVVVSYGGEDHILISGTASINNRGEVVHPGDVAAQTHRMLENVEALLKEAGTQWDKVKMMVVYLRNPEDYDKVEAILKSRFSIPMILTHAPVCRPAWLVEMECIA